MSLETELQNLATAIATDMRDHSVSLTGVSNSKSPAVQGGLDTAATNIVAAINELHTEINAAAGSAVTSVNGEAGPGAVTIGTGEVAEGANLYFTEARVLASVLAGYAAAAGTVSATDTVVQALQKLDGNIQAIDLTDLIDDAASGAATTYSSNKIDSDIAAAVAGLVDTSPAALDTLNELAAALGDDPDFATTIATQLGLKADKTEIKTVTELGATVDTRDYAAEYIAARDA